HPPPDAIPQRRSPWRDGSRYRQPPLPRPPNRLLDGRRHGRAGYYHHRRGSARRSAPLHPRDQPPGHCTDDAPRRATCAAPGKILRGNETDHQAAGARPAAVKTASMTLGFTTHFQDGTPTLFVEKIVLPYRSELRNQYPDIAPKIHTFRLGYRWRAGMKMHLVTGNRTPQRRQFGQAIPELE